VQDSVNIWSSCISLLFRLITTKTYRLHYCWC
jgi:hypothetical protein